jgi:hypothetical protein
LSFNACNDETLVDDKEDDDDAITTFSTVAVAAIFLRYN